MDRHEATTILIEDGADAPDADAIGAAIELLSGASGVKYLVEHGTVAFDNSGALDLEKPISEEDPDLGEEILDVADTEEG